MPNQADGQQQTPNLVVKSSSIPNHTSISNDVNPENTSEGSLSRTLSDETIEYETLLSTLDVSRASNLSATNEILRTRIDRSTPSINLRLHLPLYKIQLLLLTRNLKAAKREVKLAMNIDSSRTLLLKSQLEYARGNYPKAFKLLRASNTHSDVGNSIIINNNIGCIYFQQGNLHTSSIFFHKSLNNCSSLWKEKPLKLTTFSQDKSLLIAYNCGVQYLVCGKPVLAARCFLKAGLVLYNRPLLWVRLAECCLMALEIPRHETRVEVQVIGQGKWRYLAFANGSLRSGIMGCYEEEDFTPGNNVKPNLSLSFARQCLFNALHLLENSELKCTKSCSSRKSPPEENGTDGATAKNSGHKNLGQVNANGDAIPHSSTTPSKTFSEYVEICQRDFQKTKQAILIDLAFIELEIGNPLKALSIALTVLKIPECSRMYAFWGRVYAAEALCLLNRPNEASEHLSTYLSGGNVELPYSEEDSRQWQPKKNLDPEDSNTGQNTTRDFSREELQDNVFLSPEEARGTLYVNLSVMHVLQGEFELASRYATQALASLPNNQEAALIAVYLDLKLEKPREALVKLKRYSRVRFLPLTSIPKPAS